MDVEIPQNVEAEQQLLGAIMVDNAALDRVADLLQPEHFFDSVHGQLFEAATQLVSAGRIASPITLRGASMVIPGMSDLGGPAYLARLASSAVALFAVREYAELIVEAFNKRALLNVSEDIQARLAHSQATAVDIADVAAGAIEEVVATNTVKPLLKAHVRAAAEAVSAINEAYQGGEPPGVATGIKELDDTLQRLRPGQVIVVAGRPSMGKTTLAQVMAFNAAQAGVGVYFGSLEMPAADLATRFISLGLAHQRTRIPYSKMTSGKLQEWEMRAVVEEAQRQESLPLMMGERDVRELSRLHASIKSAQRRMADTPMPLGLCIVDYVQILDVPGLRSPHEEIKRSMHVLKNISMSLGVPVVALAQVGRSVEQRDNKRPMLADLKESGALEETGDVVLFCYRDAYYLQRACEAVGWQNLELAADFEATKGDLELIVAKQRSGRIGTVRAYIDPPTGYIADERPLPPEAEAARLI